MVDEVDLVPMDGAIAAFLARVLDDLLDQVADADAVRSALSGLGLEGTDVDQLVAYVTSQAAVVAELADVVPLLVTELAKSDPDLLTLVGPVADLVDAVVGLSDGAPAVTIPALPDAGSVIDTLLALAVERTLLLRSPAGWSLAKALHLVGPELPFLTVLSEVMDSPTGFVWRRFQHLRRHLDITIGGIVSGPRTTSFVTVPVSPTETVAPEVAAAVPSADVVLQRVTLRLAADTFDPDPHVLTFEVLGHDPGNGDPPEFAAVVLMSEAVLEADPGTGPKQVRVSETVSVGLDPFMDSFGIAATGWDEVTAITSGPPSLRLGVVLGKGFTFGAPGGLRLVLSSPVLEAGISVEGWGLRAGLESLELIVPQGIAGPVLAMLLPSDGVRLQGRLVVVADEDGIHAEGGVGLRTTWPDTLRLPGLFVRGLTTEVVTGGGPLTLAAAGTVTVDLGVLTVTVEGLGLQQPLELRPSGDGNLGLVHLGTTTLATPTGIGVSVDAGVVKGGGYLRIEEHGASGALELSLTLGTVELAIRAVGVVESVEGHVSFVVVMSVEFSPPIELFLGLTLNAVGGVLGINRTLDADALTATVRSGRMSDVMFPHDLAERAVEVIAAVKPVFPARIGQVVAGPMLKLGWGRPVSFVSVSVGVVFTFPDPVQVAIIGSVRIGLPTPDLAVIDIRADFSGTINASTGEVRFDASLADSRIATFDVTGDLALRAGPSGFLVTAGGFYPGFPVPAGLGEVRRLGISIAPSPLLSIRADAYFAVTASTVQFGGGLYAVAELGPIAARGHLALDVLIRTQPVLAFTAELRGQFRLSFEGEDILSADLEVLLEGPELWHARARAEISFLFFTVSGSLELTWGERTSVPEPVVHVAEKVRAALEAPPVWAHVLPADVGGLVLLREGADALHPLGRLRLTQTVAPLGVPLAHFGSAAVTDTGPVEVSVIADLTTPEPADELFAAAQYFDLSDEEKISKPAFVPQRAGYVLQGSGWAPLSDTVVGEVVYEESSGEQRPAPGRRRLVGLDETFLDWSLTGAAGRARGQGVDVVGPLAGLAVTDTTYAVVDAATATLADGSGFGSLEAFAASTRRSADTVVMADYELAGLTG